MIEFFADDIADAEARSMLRQIPPQRTTTLRTCLEILAGYTPGHFELRRELTDDASISAAAWLAKAPDEDDPVCLDDPAQIYLEGGLFRDGGIVGTLSVCFLHKVSAPLEILPSFSGIWDIAAGITQVEGVLKWTIIWRA